MHGHTDDFSRQLKRWIEIDDAFIAGISFALADASCHGINFGFTQLLQCGRIQFAFVVRGLCDSQFQDSSADFVATLPYLVTIGICSRTLCLGCRCGLVYRKRLLFGLVIFSNGQRFWRACKCFSPRNAAQFGPLVCVFAIKEADEVLAEFNPDPARSAKIDATMILLVSLLFRDDGAVQAPEWSGGDLSGSAPAIFIPNQINRAPLGDSG